MGTAAAQPGADWTPGETQPAKWMDPHQRTYYKEATHEAPPYPTRPFDAHASAGHVNQPNSFTGVSSAAAERNAKLQHILNKTLGADYIASRQGGGGSKLNYLEGWRAINLANDVFGFNGWFTDIKYLEADFVDYDPASERWHVGVTAIVRVRLQDGASHEDVGYGKMENCRSKGEALDKSKKEAVTDGLKRALRHFGKLLGNCLYDKHYLEHIKNVKAPKPKLDWDAMYKPERDNLAAMSSTAHTGAPPLAGVSTSEGGVGGPSAGPAPKREPPPPVPAAFAAKVQRASTVGGIPPQQVSKPPPQKHVALPSNAASRPPADVGVSVGAGAPQRTVPRPAVPQQQQSTKKPIQLQRAMTVPNPAVRSGGAETPVISSDDDSLFGAMELPGKEAMLAVVAAAAATGADGSVAVGLRDDSGFGEMEGLADTSLAGAIGMEKRQPQQPASHAPARATHAVGTDAAASLVEQKKLEAMARRAAKQRQKDLEQQQHQTSVISAQNAAPVSAAHMLGQKNAARGADGLPLPPLGSARPVALRPNQPPQAAAVVGRTNSMQRTRSVGQNVVGDGPQAAALGGAGPRVAGSIPSIQPGAGVVKAVAGSHATIANRAGGGGQASTVPGAAYVANGAIVPDGVAFQSARGMKRGPDDGERYGAGAPTSTNACSAQPQSLRNSASPRRALQELAVDELTGDVKRQRTSLG
ncbi:hypothetical protein JCM3774_006760 [Rhodotorula dairenensis]